MNKNKKTVKYTVDPIFLNQCIDVCTTHGHMGSV